MTKTITPHTLEADDKSLAAGDTPAQPRQGATRSRGVAGAGPGLAITYRLCRLAGGAIEAERGCGVGSAFAVRLLPSASNEGHR